mmetsp:Transcript_10855/g.27337  ORF Transcript_10855/g.27337 Transcript_10855/m.27337 type:complete len:205 (-) Transcript_10855:440-1054(-)
MSIVTEKERHLGDSVERGGVCKALFEAVVNSLELLVVVSAGGVHRDRELGPPPHALLVLLLQAEVAPQRLEEPVAVAAQARSPDLAARVVHAVIPIQVLGSDNRLKGDEEDEEGRTRATDVSVSNPSVQKGLERTKRRARFSCIQLKASKRWTIEPPQCETKVDTLIPAVVVRVDELVGEKVVHLLLRLDVVLADDHPRRRPET